MNKLISNFVLLLVFSCFISTFYSCTQNKKSIEKKEYEINKKILLLDSLYNHNVDSAIIYASTIELEILQSQNPAKIVDYYSFVSEVYQYVIPNETMALEYATKALNMMVLYSQLIYNNPYVFINIGNVLFMNDLYKEAIEMYYYALEIEHNNRLIKTLIYNNIASSYLKLNNCELSAHYFYLAEKYIYDKNHLMFAQNYIYKIDHALYCKKYDSILHFYDIALSNLKRQKPDLSHTDKDYYGRNQLLLYQLYVELGRYMSSYFKDTDKVKSIVFLRYSIKYALILNQAEIIADTYYEMAEFFLFHEEQDSAVYFAKKAYSSISNTTKYQNILQILELIYNYSSEPEQFQYGNLINQYKDSLFVQNNLQDKEKNKLRLAQANVLISLSEYKRVQLVQETRIRNQNLIIIIISALSVFLVIALIFNVIYNRRLLVTQKQLARRTIELSLIETETNKFAIKNTNKLLSELDELMFKEKIYLNKKLKLEDIAEKLNTNLTYVSRIINEKFDLKFNDYINNLRIKEACFIISQTENEKLSINQLYNMVGFESRATFYSAFKKFTGVTPAVYIKMKSD